MTSRKRRYESMLFNYETTGRSDFRDGRIRPKVTTTKFHEKPSCARIRPPPLKDIHSLTDWYKPIVPFSLMHKPKEIVHTNPRLVQKPYSEPEDIIREEVQKTRPRLVMTPAVSMDDIEPSTRKMLLDDIYTTTLMEMTNSAKVDSGSSLRAPLPSQAAPANPITLEKLKPPYVSPEWRMDSVGWDNRQRRAYCVPTREYWLAWKSECEVCKETAEREAFGRQRRKAKQQ